MGFLDVLQLKAFDQLYPSWGKLNLADYCFVTPRLFFFFFSLAKLCLKSHLQKSRVRLILEMYFPVISQLVCQCLEQTFPFLTDWMLTHGHQGWKPT